LFSRFRFDWAVSSPIQVTCIDNYIKRRCLEYTSLRSSSFGADREPTEPERENLGEKSGTAASSNGGPIHDPKSHFMNVPYSGQSPIVPLETLHVAVASSRPQDEAWQISSDNRLDLETDADFPRNLYLAEIPEASCSYGSSPQANLLPPRLHRLDPLTPISDLPSLHQVTVAMGGTSSLSDLPKVVVDNRQYLQQEDYEFLGLKSVWQVPPLPVVKSAIQRFIDYIYPSLPVVDICTELEALETDGESRKISLMLLYAMVLPGIPFMDSTAISEAGYASSSEFAKSIYGRIKVRLHATVSLNFTYSRSSSTTSTMSRIVWLQYNVSFS
jgi:hypothetical protein